MTLAEFLLARITEQQRHAEALWVTMQSDSFTAPARLVNFGAIVDPRKVLTECEAKRRIVTECAATDPADWHGWPRAQRFLGLLALPYADHPDYRDEWRPS